MKRSAWIENEIRQRAAKLDEFCSRITRCRVVVEIPHKHHQQGNYYLIRIDLCVPGKKIVVSREAPEHAPAEDFNAVVRDAFDAARRQVQDYVHRRRHQTKTHAQRPRGRVSRIFPQGYGFIESADGREIYFHSHSLINERFGDLQVGAQVAFEEEDGENGPQASTVRVLEPPGSIAS
jgi:cold shock CspA family protein/ribosome-associated translation inhibitor RaiA